MSGEMLAGHVESPELIEQTRAGEAGRRWQLDAQVVVRPSNLMIRGSYLARLFTHMTGITHDYYT